LLTSIARQSSPRPSSPVNSPIGTPGSTSGRPSSPTPPGGPKTAIRRRAAADQKDKVANARPSSTRAAGAGGSSSTMLSECSFVCFLIGMVEESWRWEGFGCGYWVNREEVDVAGGDRCREIGEI
jgi:hypothetical protein